MGDTFLARVKDFPFALIRITSVDSVVENGSGVQVVFPGEPIRDGSSIYQVVAFANIREYTGGPLDLGGANEGIVIKKQ